MGASCLCLIPTQLPVPRSTQPSLLAMRHTGPFASGHLGMEVTPGVGFSVLTVEAVGVPAGLGQLPTRPRLLTSCQSICTFILKMPAGLARAQMAGGPKVSTSGGDFGHPGGAQGSPTHWLPLPVWLLPSLSPLGRLPMLTT